MDLNIRNVPEELLRKLKSEAAIEGKTLRELVLDVLAEGVGGGTSALKGPVVKKETVPVSEKDAGPILKKEPKTEPPLKKCSHGILADCNCQSCQEKRAMMQSLPGGKLDFDKIRLKDEKY